MADNNGAIALSENPVFHANTKHISITMLNLRKLPNDVLRADTAPAALHATDPHTSSSPATPRDDSSSSSDLHAGTSSVENTVTNALSPDSSPAWEGIASSSPPWEGFPDD
ncbi:hypothetical protein MYU51_014293 [Penicillium brevicompactum]